ncbi:hypothetical protein B0T17DRAFT_485782 [Bombardia bombarda]|uniref:DUF1996 domain-containing protein n=1 Tax=Bombardia bombarda TaxID=252184 RepID=A0AA39XJV3_9PEZI|nr:hypothetical protein B0T17DRAFT_485782 [Bombardia bombarda]
MKIDTSLVVLATVSGAAAFWRMECRGRAGLARIDPLVNPGEVGQHVHHIHASSGFSEKATYDDLVNAECTSCAVTQDKSAYWAPALYFNHANGTYQAVEQVGGMLAYYFLRPDANNPKSGVTAFPEDFRMIARDSLRRNYSIGGQDATKADPEQSLWAALGQTTQTDLEQRAVGFNCLDYNKAPEGSLYRHYMPDKDYLDANCKDGVRIEVMFPSCWNGKDLDTKNHRDHVAYPDLVMAGGCPEGFDVKLPGLFYETIWATNAFAGVDGKFVVANGDEKGFGYHADFIMGWESVDYLQSAVDVCTNDSGKIQDCPLFNIQDEPTQRQCQMKLPSAIAKEKVEGLVGETLPGDVAIQFGPEPATNKNPGPQTTTVAVPTVSYSAGISVSASGSPVVGGVFKQSTTIPTPSASAAAFSAQAVDAPASAVTPAPVAPAALAGDYEVVRTEYHTVGNAVNMVIVKEAVEYQTIATTTVTVQAAPSAKARREAHAHRHRRSGRARR